MMNPNKINILQSEIFELFVLLLQIGTESIETLRLHNKSNDHNLSATQTLLAIFSTLTHEEIEEVKVFFNPENTMGMIPVLGLHHQQIYNDFDALFDALNALPSETFIHTLLATSYSKKSIHSFSSIQEIKTLEAAYQYIDDMQLSDSEKWKLYYMVNHPNQTKERYIKLLKHFYTHYFTKHLTTIRKHSKDLLNHVKALAKEKDIETLCQSLLPIQLEEYLPTHTITLCPSVLLMNKGVESYYSEESLYLYQFGYQFLRKKTTPKLGKDKLVMGLKALGDEKRFKLLLHIKEHQSYGHELGKLLNLSNSAISHHLSQLVNEEIILSTREENKIYYRINPDKIHSISKELITLLLNEDPYEKK